MTGEIPIVCDLGRLDPRQRAREQELLAWFKRSVRRVDESARGYRYFIDADPTTLAAAGELMALERLCCPFLEWTLGVSSGEHACVEIAGREGIKAFLAAEFGS